MMVSCFPLDKLTTAWSLVKPSLHRTPLLSSRTLSRHVGAPVFLKCENLQKTGSFKVRGALHSVMRLMPDQRKRGISTISAGNHAQAVAWAGSRAGVETLVVMPESASVTKVAAALGYGAEVVLHGDAEAAFERVGELTQERGLTFLHPFDDEDVIAGHASCGFEILEDLPEVGTVVVPVGGGGLASGIALAVATKGSDAAVHGVEPEGASTMYASLAAGRPMRMDSPSTVADGLAPPMAGDLTYAVLSSLAHGVSLVSDREIVSALRLILERAKLLVEPSGAAAVAALIGGRVELDPSRPVVAVLSGGNADLRWLASALAENGESSP